MFSPAELTKMRLIKAMALTGRAAEVSRVDKQWVLNIVARENKKVPLAALQAAQQSGYNVASVPVQL